jgi:hypothetical protein
MTPLEKEAWIATHDKLIGGTMVVWFCKACNRKCTRWFIDSEKRETEFCPDCDKLEDK